MLELAIAIVGILAVVIPFAIQWYTKSKRVRDALARAELAELEAGLDRVDELDKRVLSPPKQWR